MVVAVVVCWILLKVYAALCARKDRHRREHICLFWQMTVWTAMMGLPASEFIPWWTRAEVDYSPKFLRSRFFYSTVTFPNWEGEIANMVCEATAARKAAKEEAYREMHTHGDTSVSNLTALNRRNRFRVVKNDE